jgi:hypothetical protein
MDLLKEFRGGGTLFPLGSQKYERMFYFFHHLCFIYGQVWLNPLIDGPHFNYITKLKKKTKGQPPTCNALVT